MYFWLEYKIYSMHLPSLKLLENIKFPKEVSTLGKHLENIMYLNDIIFYYIIKYFIYLCDFPRVFQGGKLSCFPSVGFWVKGSIN